MAMVMMTGMIGLHFLHGLLSTGDIAGLQRLADLPQRTIGLYCIAVPGQLAVGLLGSLQISGFERFAKILESLLALLPIGTRILRGGGRAGTAYVHAHVVAP